MDFFSNLYLGFSVFIDPFSILFCLIGVVLGLLVGVLPGLGPGATIALLLPLTYYLTPLNTIIMVAGLYYGAKYGGSITSILLNIPGEADSVVTAIEGHPLARQGKASTALGISITASLVGGTIATIGLMLLAPTLAKVALSFGPPEITSMMLLALVLVTYLSSGSQYKGLAMISLGLFLGSVRLDDFTTAERFTFDLNCLLDGVGIVPLIMGLFGVSEVLSHLGASVEGSIFKSQVKRVLPRWSDIKQVKWPMIRGTLIGFFVGLIPGGGGVAATFTSYSVEKKLSKEPEKFGTGVLGAVAGAESANNACSGANFIPLMTLGIPTNGVMAMIFAALLIAGLQPGPLLIQQDPQFFWGVIASMYAGNIILVLLTLPLIGMWVRFLSVPYNLLFPGILFFCLLGSYAMNNTVDDVVKMICFGILGLAMRRFRYEAAPLIMGFVLSPLMESAFIRSMIMSEGNFTIFFTRPICLVFIGIALLMLILPILQGRRRPLEGRVEEED